MAYSKNKPKSSPPKVTSSPATSDFEQAVETRRVKDVEGARSLFSKLISDDVQRSATIANTRNQLEGGRPYDPAQLTAQGAAWQTNVNFGDAQAALNRTILPYWRMVNEVPHRGAFTVESTAPQSDQWGIAFAEAFDEFHEDWGADYHTQFMKFSTNFVSFGPGGAMWDDPDTARYKSINVQRVYWPKNTQMSPDEWEVVAFVRDVSAAELYQKIRDKKTTERAEYAGWNSKAIKTAIVQMKDGGQNPDARDYTRFQDLMVNNDIVITSPFQPMACVWLYVKNYDGKIGCYVFPQQTGVDEFLYQDDDCADTFRHLMGFVWYDTGTDGMVHSIKGFAVKNFYFSSLINRMKSRLVDGATIAAGINFQYRDDNIPEESPPVENAGPFTIFPPSITQLTVYPNLQAAGGVLEMLSANRDQNNSLYRDSSNSSQIENTDTATQAKILASQQGQMSEASAAIFLSQLGENVFTEQVRRLRKKGNKNPDAVAFVARLREKGVPDSVIFDARIRVKTGANAGMANPVMMKMKFDEGMALMNLPGVNARWMLENKIAYTWGSQAVKKALLPLGAESEPQQRRQALMENGDFGQGIVLPVAPEDAHLEHIEEHLKPLTAIVQQFKQTQNVNPDQLPLLTYLTEHTGQHMAYLAADDSKKEQFRAVTPIFREVESVVRGILTRIQSQAQNPGQSPVAPFAQTG